MSTARVPVMEGLFSDESGEARLLGSRCSTCNTPYFPRSDRCHNPECDVSQVQDDSFGPRGTLWSYSVQNYPPPPPARYDEPFEPYALCVVDLDDGLRVVGRMAADDAGLEVGSKVELALGPICHEDDGTEVISWMFRSV
ncbi:MAG: hypothetical protein JJLCMIEE_03005 [Acidimicrobiales bacterium]|nr:MAG: benzoylsuccinyl-CoA thiolase [Actinomycetota bacterium]MBV6509890.1 hypothetical protein [Acidimicrobiales bacterium]RIK03292.1 MAG: benzoylsuccinyl-CoA thiolase [Acidobacteriota bacterium]